MNTRRISLARKVIGLFVITILVAQQNPLAQEAFKTETFSVSDDVNIDVATSGGWIKAIGTNSDEVKVEMFVKKKGKSVSAGDVDLSNWEIIIEKSGNEIIASAKRKKRAFNSDKISISFLVESPKRATFDVKTSGGSISFKNLIGDQEGKTSGGKIKAGDIDGNVELNTSGGQVNLANITGFAEVKTSGGKITAESIDGGISAHTSGGSITLDNVSGNVEAKSSGGSIKAEIVEPNEYIELKTSGGRIEIVVPKDLGYDVNLDGSRVNADMQNFTGEYERDEMTGTLNGGGVKINAKTSGGSVTLKYM